MKIATYNIDWLNKRKIEIENILNETDFDFLILTEAIDVNLKNYKYKYFTDELPQNYEYETQNYSEILNGKKGHRTIIYSKYPALKKYFVQDKKTSIACEFETEYGKLVVYGTIIGTLYNRKPFAEIELKNCISDCIKIHEQNQNLIIVGDLNTAFLEADKKKFKINHNTTEFLIKLFENLNLVNATMNIKENIDHIIIPKSFQSKIKESEIFIPKKSKKDDHHGIFINIE
ncbi:endonuclease/exonuclease/phosphatase family protein [Chryseobacterium koreense]|uniref:Endonuclease/exonuclease/phosphatase domain-containing protein n=1 Tax=Chryseobacterium koreense CCUG 49689 TaxID=1304281 RepID=A0A0J7LG69_9FLAO|nr:endonuclease/exonuclease/phosphatase family protein [Chryseobacterium koreense]KMQ67995.1 hypothetical protein ACM44_14715 [Chryseobacterium koreense CCUG 49689]MBB5334890.1 endonuclease/exonuclease/phosphatase family metal-dependent hydrolase [Chryseobacterium koreense]